MSGCAATPARGGRRPRRAAAGDGGHLIAVGVGALVCVALLAVVGRSFLLLLERVGLRAPSRPAAIAEATPAPLPIGPAWSVAIVDTLAAPGSWDSAREEAWRALAAEAVASLGGGVVEPGRWRAALNLRRRGPADLHRDEALGREFLRAEKLDALLLPSLAVPPEPGAPWEMGLRLVAPDAEASVLLVGGADGALPPLATVRDLLAELAGRALPPPPTSPTPAPEPPAD